MPNKLEISGQIIQGMVFMHLEMHGPILIVQLRMLI